MRSACRFGRAAGALGLVVALAGCGGSPSSPTPAPTPTPAPVLVPVIRDGLSNQLVAAQVTPPAPASGQRMAVTATGYLPREQLFERAEIFLWPGEADYIREVAYWEFTD